jgi:hypothetical protein
MSGFEVAERYLAEKVDVQAPAHLMDLSPPTTAGSSRSWPKPSGRTRIRERPRRYPNACGTAGLGPPTMSIGSGGDSESLRGKPVASKKTAPP